MCLVMSLFLYTQIDKDASLTKNKEFCKMFTKIQKSIVIPKYLYDNEDFIVENKIL